MKVNICDTLTGDGKLMLCDLRFSEWWLWRLHSIISQQEVLWNNIIQRKFGTKMGKRTVWILAIKELCCNCRSAKES
jgi:hypothetical protein